MSWFGIWVRGLAMGAADAVPGVSGGTVAFLTGIYERWIAVLIAIRPDLWAVFRREGSPRTLVASGWGFRGSPSGWNFDVANYPRALDQGLA